VGKSSVDRTFHLKYTHPYSRALQKGATGAGAQFMVQRTVARHRKREIHHSPSLEKLRINLYGEMHPDYKKSSRMQRPNENTGVHTQCFCLLLHCWFHLNGYRGSADQTHAALIIMCVCCVSVCIHARPFCSHYAGNPITTQSSKGGDDDECRGAHT
jgi:hypothetical protein